MRRPGVERADSTRRGGVHATARALGRVCARSPWAPFVVAFGLLLPLPGRARADGGARAFSLAAEVTCDPLPGPGKVQCLVRVRPIGGSLAWSDAIVRSAPPFAPPLRTRVAVGDAKRNDGEGADFSLALAATGDGVGELKVLARATVCGDGGCRPVQAEASARVVVGATSKLARPAPSG